MKTYSPACNLQTKQYVWSVFQNGYQMQYKDEPIVETAARIASYHTIKFS